MRHKARTSIATGVSKCSLQYNIPSPLLQPLPFLFGVKNLQAKAQSSGGCFKRLLSPTLRSPESLHLLVGVQEKVGILFYIFGFFLKKILLIFRERGRDEEREGEKYYHVVASCAPYWGLGPQPRHVPSLGIKLVILWFAGWHLIH